MKTSLRGALSIVGVALVAVAVWPISWGCSLAVVGAACLFVAWKGE